MTWDSSAEESKKVGAMGLDASGSEVGDLKIEDWLEVRSWEASWLKLSDLLSKFAHLSLLRYIECKD